MAAKGTDTQERIPNNARILYLLRILQEETDADGGLSLPQIQERLEGYGISVERKSLYRDLDALARFGVEVGKLPTRPVTYYLSNRPFEPSQMMLLVDAVQTSKSITKENSEALVEKLKGLVSGRTAESLQARVHVAGRVKSQNESIFNALDNIQRAMSERRDIAFNYLRHDVRMKLGEIDAHDGRDRVRTPLCIIYSNDKYYLLAYDEEAKDNIRIYRVDRMSAVRLAEPSPKDHNLPAGFDMADYERQMIGMFAGRPVSIKLLVSEDNVESIIDLFGIDEIDGSVAEDIPEIGDGRSGDPDNSQTEGVEIPNERRWAAMRVKAAPNPVLFGTIAQFGGDVRIVSPKRVADAYEAHLQRVLEAQRVSRDDASKHGEAGC